MQYKGYTISPVYFVGSDLRELKDGSLVPKKRTSKDIEYYEIYDPKFKDGAIWGSGLSVKECKEDILEMIQILKDNDCYEPPS